VAADHIAELVGQGWRLAEIARAAGLSNGVVSKAARHGYQLDASTEEAILKVALY
jgi:DNA-binding LacI/PurR family transcriptional regulator